MENEQMSHGTATSEPRKLINLNSRATPEELLDYERREARIPNEITFPHPGGFLVQAIRPFEPSSLHPKWGPIDKPRSYIQDTTDT